MTVAESIAARTGYWLRVSIAWDGLCQAFFHFGEIGLTISARAGTAQAHAAPWGQPVYWRHAWGVWLFSALDYCWPFGRDKTTGESHCIGAEKNDCIRAVKGPIKQILGDPVVVAKHDLYEFRRDLLAELTKILGDA